jgi:hypothetical protein
MVVWSKIDLVDVGVVDDTRMPSWRWAAPSGSVRSLGAPWRSGRPARRRRTGWRSGALCAHPPAACTWNIWMNILYLGLKQKISVFVFSRKFIFAFREKNHTTIYENNENFRENWCENFRENENWSENFRINFRENYLIFAWFSLFAKMSFRFNPNSTGTSKIYHGDSISSLLLFMAGDNQGGFTKGERTSSLLYTVQYTV